MYSLMIINDSRQERDEIKDVLANTGLFNRFHEAPDGASGFETVVSARPDLIIYDILTSGRDGFKFLRSKKERKDLNNIPVLIVTGDDNIMDKIRGLEEGAQDYIVKPFNPLELVARVKANLRVKLLQDELKQANEKLEILSNTDPLTGLHNRRYFFDMLRIEFERARRYNTMLSLLMIDIDYFKSVNDRYGHLSGDGILSVVARILESGLRTIDSCARYGGEEFVVMLPETDVNGATSVGNRYLAQIKEHDFSDICQDMEKLTVSIGIACMGGAEYATTPDKLLKYADDALYVAKRKGRNTLAVYDL